MSDELKLEKRYTDKQFCEIYQISRNTAARWRSKGLLKFIVTATGQIRYLESHLTEFDRKNEGRARKQVRAA